MKLATVNPDIDFNNLMNLQPKDVRLIALDIIWKIAPLMKFLMVKNFRWFKFLALHQVQFINLRWWDRRMPTNLNKATLSLVSWPTEWIRTAPLTHWTLHVFRISMHTISLALMDMKMFHHKYDSSRLHWLCASRTLCIFKSYIGNTDFQLGALWEDDLQSVVQIGIGQSQEIVSSSQSFHGDTNNLMNKFLFKLRESIPYYWLRIFYFNSGILTAAEMKTEF